MGELTERERCIVEKIKGEGQAGFFNMNDPSLDGLFSSAFSAITAANGEHGLNATMTNIDEGEFLNGVPNLPSLKINDRLLDDTVLSRSFCRLRIKEDFGGFDDHLSLGIMNSEHNVEKYGGSYWGFNSDGRFDFESFQPSFHGVCDDGNHTFSGGLEKDCFVSMGSPLVADNLSNDVFSDSGWYDNHSDYPFQQRGTGRNSSIRSPNSAFNGICFHDHSSFPQYYKRNGNCLMAVNVTEDTEGFNSEDGYTIQKQVFCDARKPFQSEKMNSLNQIPFQTLHGKSIKLDSCTFHRGNWQNDQNLSSYSPLSRVPNINSLKGIQGNVYSMAQDQNGCRWIQKILDEGTNQHIQVIFDGIIHQVVELMLKPFGNYVIQKLLEVCNEEQRLQIVFMVTEEPGRFLRICSNAYGTRSVQKLVETMKTRQQISLVMLALKPVFLDLVKDPNGNHVIQCCLRCLDNGDNKFIFDAAVEFSVQIATHRHGCCVMQRCLARSTRKQREQLTAEISKNALLLAQDPFGNYVVQCIVELLSPSATVSLLSQFKWHYVHLSMQKCSSHVVEKCLKDLEASREQIVHELISVSRFDHLLQDPFANYVIQSALEVTKGPLRASLVAAVRPHVILRSNPYCKRIFSRNLLRKMM